MADPAQEEDLPLPASLRFLKNLVTVLTGVMILGMVAVIVLLVVFLNQDRRPVLVHPDVFDIPAGVETVGYSVVNGYTIVIGDDGIIRVFASDTRNLVDEMDLNTR
ncbi:DUF6476 family protein [Hasllibacter sp. MH4015]|uniref:DUF6476 family protein n=1 Tax=Hasllibacter sp. MH4015 TaxID=2854029 RepID=UPI001CD5F30A|nr:DUF6476 family protein [Hasllibacter sp. MH4015]